MKDFRIQTKKAIEENKLIVIMRGLDEPTALKTTEALYNGGVRLVEVAFDQNGDDKVTANVIRALVHAFGDKMCIGAGTVLTKHQLMLACQAGAKYVISPNVNAEVIKWTRRAKLVSVPGAMTPTEIQFADTLGADFVKIFPAGTLGAKYFKDVATPLSHVKMLAVSGITTENIGDFVKAGAVGFGISGAILSKDALARGDYSVITENARKFVEKL